MIQVKRYVLIVVVYTTSMCIYQTAYKLSLCLGEVYTDLIINISDILLVNYSVWFETQNKFILFQHRFSTQKPILFSESVSTSFS